MHGKVMRRDVGQKQAYRLREHRDLVTENPMSLWLPSQRGILAEAPHRQRVTRFRSSRTSPFDIPTGISPLTHKPSGVTANPTGGQALPVQHRVRSVCQSAGRAPLSHSHAENGGRMYRLVALPEFGEHELKLSSNSDDFALFAFTFGENSQAL